MGFILDARAEKNLIGVHKDLVKVVRKAITTSPIEFTITEGVRTLARQKQLLAAGATRTLNSRHITGHAVDVAAKVGNTVRWDWPLYEKIAAYMLDAAEELSIPVIWGGSWKTFKDGPHFELDIKTYPA